MNDTEQHWPEPWDCWWEDDGENQPVEVAARDDRGDSWLLAEMVMNYGREHAAANGRRICACVNACAGLPDPAADLARLRAERDELVSACRELLAAESKGIIVASSGPCPHRARARIKAMLASIAEPTP